MAEWVKTYDLRGGSFEEDREKILRHVEYIKSKHDTKFAKMSSSDYKLEENPSVDTCLPIVTRMVRPALENYMRQYHCEILDIRRVWFAEYFNGADFGWHTHEGCNLSAVLHIVCEEEYATELLGYKHKMGEGDFIVFPAMLPHRGKPVHRGRKLVIGFNIDMAGSTLNEPGA